MAETGKKAKEAAKPRAESTTPKKTAAKKAAPKAPTVAEKVSAITPSHDEIARLAQKYWAERGHQDGHAEQDWLRAERELQKMAS